MNTRLPITILLAVLTTILGCSGDTTSPFTRSEVVVTGFLYVGEAMTEGNGILITRTQPVDLYYDFENSVIKNATVTIRREGQAEADTLRFEIDSSYGNRNLVIDPLTTYHLRVEIPGEDPITATTTTPSPFEVRDAPREEPETIRHEEAPDTDPITVACPDEEQIFMIDVYCHEKWQDARYVSAFGDHDRPDDEQEYGGYNGEPRHIFAYFRLQDLERAGDAFLIDWYSAMMVFYGSYELQLLTIDDNYYNYLFREHPERSGGIVGGIGVFGSADRKKFFLEIVE